MSEQSRAVDPIPEFEIALWGYDREQVDRCLYDLIARLEDESGINMAGVGVGHLGVLDGPAGRVGHEVDGLEFIRTPINSLGQLAYTDDHRSGWVEGHGIAPTVRT
jgi:hypothetical protein